MTTTVLIGGYTQSLPHVDGHAPGIMTSRFDGEGLSAPTLAASVVNPSWLTATRNGDAVYAVEENDIAVEGAVVVLRRDPTTGRLHDPVRVASGGTAPAHLALEETERHLVTANYGSGTVVVHELGDDGRIGDRVDAVQHSGRSVDPERQEAPHPHQAVFDPATGILVVPDLGTDAVYRYHLAAGSLIEIDRLVLEPGTGPRHVAFHPDGRHLFVIGELSASIDVFRRDEPDRGFRRVQRVSLLGEHDTPAAGEILVSADGATVFASNRGDNPVVVVLGFDESRLAPVSRVPAPSTPRAMTLLSGDRMLVVAGQDSDELVTYAFDAMTRRLTRRAAHACPTPTCVLAMPAR